MIAQQQTRDRPGYLTPYPPAGGFSGQGPSVRPVVYFTLLFGFPGLISATRRAERAKAVGDSAGKYWLAFGATLTLGWVIGAIATILLLTGSSFFGAAEGTSSTTTITAAQLSQSMVEQGTVTRSGHTVYIKAATCTATSVDAHGAGDYKCAVALTDASRETLTVRADADGWRILSQTK
jgi:hypothetical protein